MGLKIENTGLPPMKVLISKKLHILRPAIEYVQQISKPKKVRLLIDVDADDVCVVISLFALKKFIDLCVYCEVNKKDVKYPEGEQQRDGGLTV